MSFPELLPVLLASAPAASGITDGLVPVVGVPTGIAAVVVLIYRYVVKPELDAGRELIATAIETSNKEREGLGRLTAALQEATGSAKAAAHSSEQAAASNERTAGIVEKQLLRLEALEHRQRVA